MSSKYFYDNLFRVFFFSIVGFSGFIFYIKNPVFDTKLKVTHIPKVYIKNIKSHIDFLTQIQPPRNIKNIESLNSVAQYLFDQLTRFGYAPRFQEFQVKGKTYKNVIATFNSNRYPPLIMGAHYDVAHDMPGADDNASGTAVLLELARVLQVHKKNKPVKNSVELIFYTLEEPPSFRSKDMGSYHHALSLVKANKDIRLMVSIESVGYFTDKENTQEYPSPLLKYLFPTKGNFIALVGKSTHWLLTRKVKSLFTLTSDLAIESLNAPSSIKGIDFSDHLNYWEFNYPAIMITDTAFFRNHNYHKATDTPDTLNYKKIKQVVEGLYGVSINF